MRLQERRGVVGRAVVVDNVPVDEPVIVAEEERQHRFLVPGLRIEVHDSAGGVRTEGGARLLGLSIDSDDDVTPIRTSDPRADYLAHRAEIDAAIRAVLEQPEYVL